MKYSNWKYLPLDESLDILYLNRYDLRFSDQKAYSIVEEYITRSREIARGIINKRKSKSMMVSLAWEPKPDEKCGNRLLRVGNFFKTHNQPTAQYWENDSLADLSRILCTSYWSR